MSGHSSRSIGGVTDLKVLHITQDGRPVLKIEGTLDATTAADLETRLKPFVDPAPEHLLFDLGFVDYLSSMGLSAVLKTAIRLKSAGSECWVYDPQLSVRRVLEIAKWDHLIADPAAIQAHFPFFSYISSEEPARAARRGKSTSNPPRLYGER